MPDPALATAHLGAVTLTSTDAESLGRFYADVVGLETLAWIGEELVLGVRDETGAPRELVRIVHDPDAPRVRGVNGLFHLALLLPEQRDLGHAVRRVVEGGWQLTGASDHFVSEALYLRDPEGNGIEIYRDRPRSEWRWDGEEVEMGTVALDLQAVVDAAAADAVIERRVPPGTTMGHVHLAIADLEPAEPFYRDVLGLDVTARYARQATFLSWGGYHHHLGMNTWGGHGLIPPPPGVTGLRTFELVVPGDAARAALVARAAALDAVLAEEDGVAVLRDPSGLLARVRG